MSPVNLRVVGLGAAVTAAVLLPLVAMAGQTGEPSVRAGARGAVGGGGGVTESGGIGETGEIGGPVGSGGASKTGETSGASGASKTGGADAKPGGLLTGLGLVPRTTGSSKVSDSAGASGASGSAGALGASAPGGAASSGTSVAEVPERVTRCGPELASPDGVEAQTCVLSEGPDLWARTYYRNASGQDLDAFLTLMAPGGRTVQVHCAVPAQDEPGSCETPRERGRGAATAHTAVAEFAGAGEGGSTPLLLRAGSNAADAQGS
ncbi:hypothetical protein [Streptomyces sp. NPDC059247]|uniref:hypothetical protein n=1 Tax=Streptomyces sp. NPDC059247 TaxID=3346790 RepID=UPI00368CD389